MESLTSLIEEPEWKGHGDQRYGYLTYSEHGEDLMIVNLFHQIGILKPSYLDIGAHHPFNISNTALLYSRGSIGVNVEANPRLIEEFARARPKDVNVCKGVAATPGLKTFYLWDSHSGRNTFDKDWADKMEVRSGTWEVECVTIGDVLRTTCLGEYPDFLSIDVEGLDYEILESAKFDELPTELTPKIICTELHIGSPEIPKFMALMKKDGYQFYSRHGHNVIFVQRAIFGDENG